MAEHQICPFEKKGKCGWFDVPGMDSVLRFRQHACVRPRLQPIPHLQHARYLLQESQTERSICLERTNHC